jgi:hypothetical protein
MRSWSLRQFPPSYVNDHSLTVDIADLQIGQPGAYGEVPSSHFSHLRHTFFLEVRRSCQPTQYYGVLHEPAAALTISAVSPLSCCRSGLSRQHFPASVLVLLRTVLGSMSRRIHQFFARNGVTLKSGDRSSRNCSKSPDHGFLKVEVQREQAKGAVTCT